MWKKKRSHAHDDYQHRSGGVMAQMRDTVAGYAFWAVVIIILVLLVIFLIGKCSNAGTGPWGGQGSGNGSGGTGESEPIGEQNKNVPPNTISNNTPTQPATNTGGGDGDALNFIAVRFETDKTNPERIRVNYAIVHIPDGTRHAIEAADWPGFLNRLAAYLQTVRELYPAKPVYIENIESSSGFRLINEDVQKQINETIMAKAKYTRDQIQWIDTPAMQRRINER